MQRRQQHANTMTHDQARKGGRRSSIGLGARLSALRSPQIRLVPHRGPEMSVQVARSARLRSAPLLLSLCACSLLLLGSPTPTAAEQQPPPPSDEPSPLIQEYSGPTRDSEPWVFPLTQLCQRIARLPYIPSSASTAVDLIRAFRLSGPLEARDADGEFEWEYQVPRVRISRMEARSFPNSVEIQRSRPWHAAEVPVSDLPLDAEGADEGPNMGEADVDDGIDLARPRLLRPNLLHILAARGFHAAIAELFALMSAETRNNAVRSIASVEATLQLIGATPMHLCALYAPDDESESNVAAAKLLVQAGANLTAEIDATEGGLSPLVFAAERGHARLFAYLLSASLPASYFTPTESQVRTVDEQRALDEWSFHRRRIVEEHATGLPLKGVDGEDASWIEYIAWYDSRRPLTAAEETNAAFQSQLLRALQLAALSNRSAIVRTLLEGPGSGYGLRSRFNERSHGGRGDALIHGCIVHGLIDVASILVDHGADLALRTHDDLTAVQLAIQYKQWDMHTWLQQKLREIRPPPKGVRLPEHGPAPTSAQDSATRAKDAESNPAASSESVPPTKYAQAKDNRKKQKQKSSKEAKPHDEL